MPVALRPHLLVVDDDPALREALATTLGFDYTVHTAATGAEGLALLRQFPIACLILDAILGEEHGLDLVPAVRALRAEVPILMLTGQSTEALAIRALNTGADRYVKKSGDLGTLRTTIRDLLPDSDPTRALATRARQALDVHPLGPFDPAAFARRLGASEVQLRRAFRARYGTTPRRYLTDRRLASAAGLLHTTALGVDQIAREVGFPNGVWFTKVFKRVYRCSPSAFRTSADRDCQPTQTP
jgi:DNA-binding response OmpR family regulator